jgi:hypothetical protein
MADDPRQLVAADREIDAAHAARLHAFASRAAVVIWSVSWGTWDHGERFIARPFINVAGGTYACSGHLSAATLDELRRKLPPGLARIEPTADDDATIVEVWL